MEGTLPFFVAWLFQTLIILVALIQVQKYICLFSVYRLDDIIINHKGEVKKNFNKEVG